MTEWREVTIEELAEKIAMGPFGSDIKVETFKPCGVPIISGKHLHETRMRDKGFNFISEEHADKLSNANVFRGDVIFTHAGNIGQVSFIPENSKYERYVISQRQFYLRCNSNVLDYEFIAYYFKSPYGQYQLLANANQTGVPSLAQPVSYLKSIKVLLPPLPEQKAIAEVLSSLDDKIDLLTRQNKTLEDLAQTYFRKWFVEDSSDDWDVGKAEDYFEIGIGKTPPRKEHKWFTNNPNDKVWISIADMGKSGLFIGDSSEYLTSEAVERFNIRRVPKGSILLSFKLTVGRVAVALCELTTNEAIAHFKYKEAIYREYLYCYLKSFDYNSLGSTSSIATAINSTIIKEMPFVMPDKCKLTKFHELTAPIFRKIETNILQMTTLQKLRDTLLPKLISGEIRVKM